MTNLHSTLILAIFLPATLLADETHLSICRPSRESANLNGPVKKMTEEYNYEMSDKKYKKTHEYDEAGNLKYYRKWNYKDEVVYFTTNTFNASSCLIHQRVEDVRNKSTNDYNIVLNVPTHQIAYTCNITGDTKILTYSKDRYHMSSTIKRKGKRARIYSKYKRDAEHTPQVYIRYDDDGRVLYTEVYMRDEQKRLLQSTVTYKRKDRKNFTEYEYLAVDEHGNWTQRLLQIQRKEDGEEEKFDKFSTRTIEYYKQ